MKTQIHQGKILWSIVLLLSAISIFLYVRLKQIENNRQDQIKVVNVEYRPLVFTAGREGTVSIDTKMLGFRSNLDIEVNGFLPHNPTIKKGDPMYAYVKQVNDNININQGITILKHRELVLRPGYYYLKTNLGNLRIVVLENNLTELEKLFRLFYFYTSVAVHGRSADDLTGQDAVRFIFYTDYSSGNFCTGHVNMFESIFRDFFKKMRRINFYGLVQTPTNSDRLTGHSVLEVYADKQWVVVDPMTGFIPFSLEGKPLSFIELVKAKRNNQYVLKYLFHIPIFRGDFQYLTNMPTDNNVDYMSPGHFQDNWGTIEVINFETKKNVLYMEESKYQAMTEKDWIRYSKQYCSWNCKFKTSIVEDLY